MERIFKWIINHKVVVIIFYILACTGSAFCIQFVKVNYNISDYLPEDTPSTVALKVMDEEFSDEIPNARIMVSDISIPEALEIKSSMKLIYGVSNVTWLDDVENIDSPIEMMDSKTVDSYYKDSAAQFSVTLEDGKYVEAMQSIDKLIGDSGYMTGDAIDTAAATTSTQNEIRNIILIAVPFCLLVLILTTTSWFEPILLLGSIGVAIILNSGTNIIFGEISFVTNAAGNILQLAVSLDYSVFLLHRYEEFKHAGLNPKEAMVNALVKSVSSILSSGLTTIIGFAALVLMQFRLGSDMGLALAKGICFSLLCVFTLLPVITLLCDVPIEKTTHRPLVPKFNTFAKLVTNVMLPMVLVFFVIMVPAYLAQINNDFYYGSSNMFGENTKMAKDTMIINDTFGESTTYVLLIPEGDLATEKILSDELWAISQVTGIISYVDTVGLEIPPDFLDKSLTSDLISENYSRMIISVSSQSENEEAFSLVEQIRDISQKYYPNSYHLAGTSVTIYDLRSVITQDNIRVNLIAIAAVFVILLFTFRSILIPVILVLSIETAIWINQAFPYFTDSSLFYVGYLIISSIQLGATVDYAILLISRYLEYRKEYRRVTALQKTISAVTVSILTSGIALTVVGYSLGYMTSYKLLSQLGFLLGRGTLLSMAIVFFVLPGLLFIFDRPIEKTTLKVKFKRG